jgi:1-acyl-sn-glycerol-3-phosphate acyltransferase
VGETNPLKRLIEWRVSAALEPTPPNETLLKVQQPVYDLLDKYWFRLEVTGWERVPDRPCLVVGVHSGARSPWTPGRRSSPGGRTSRAAGCSTAPPTTCSWPRRGWGTTSAPSASSRPTGRASSRRWPKGDDVVVRPGGEVDSMRSWRKRDVATLAGRTGFVKQAIRSGVPILPVATVGGHDTVFVVSEGKWLANALDKVTGLKKTLRGANLPIVAGFPFPLAVEVLPAHLPLPAKIRTELLEPIAADDDPDRADDETYVRSVYDQVQAAIQTGMDALAAKRTLPVFG